MVVAAGLAAFLFLRTFVDLSTPVLLGGDQGFFWMYGERMLHGQLPYRDFFQFTLPGADVAHLAVFALLGPHAWVTDALIVALGASLAVLSFVVARAVMTDASAALASSVLVVLVFGQALTTTHHWWSALFLVAAVAAFGTGERNLRLACAGGLLGLATFCTQTHGVASLLAFAMFLWNRGTSRRRDLALLGGSYVVALFVAMAYFVAAAGPAAVWSCTVSYVVTQMALSGATSGLGLPEALTRDSLPALLPYLAVYALVPAGYALLPRAALRDVASDVRARLTLLWLVGVVLLFEVLISLTWVRLFAVAWPGVIVLVCVVDRARSGRRICLGVAWISVVGLACILARSTHRHHQTLVHLPGGEIVATERGDAEELEWLVEHVVPGRPRVEADPRGVPRIGRPDRADDQGSRYEGDRRA